ncbi:hypothetical protein K1719_000159 [Acacia pycnantha]|nr:hypothetical protein K1719_000159 [Acacia pycnantha]
MTLTQDDLKKIASYKVVEYVESGMVLGLGTGSMTKHTVDRINYLLQKDKLKNIIGIPTSWRETVKFAICRDKRWWRSIFREEGLRVVTAFSMEHNGNNSEMCVPVLIVYRAKIRHQFLLKDKAVTTRLIHCCCEPCALYQEYHELQHRGFDMVVGWHDHDNVNVNSILCY